MIIVNSKQQTLSLYHSNKLIKCYRVSTALNGLGEQTNSGCTPRGWHEIKQKIGDGADKGAVFVSRELTGELYNDKLKQQFPDRDWILTRIVWLSGLEEGRNLGGTVDSYQRYIYIHGTPYEEKLGTPVSKGCIRMGNLEIIELFNLVSNGEKIYIY